MEQISITDNINSILISIIPSGSTSGTSGAVPMYINKPYSVTVDIVNSIIIIRNANFGMFTIQYASVTSPSSASISALAGILAGYLNTATV